MTASLRTTKITTVSSDVMHDIERYNSTPYNLDTWFLSSTASLSADPSLEYPFYDQYNYEGTIAGDLYAPFARVIFTPINIGDIANLCVTITDPSTNETTQFCTALSAVEYAPRSSGDQLEELTLNSDISNINSGKIHTLTTKKDSQVRYDVTDIVWLDNTLPVWSTRSSSTTDAITGVTYNYTTTGDQLKAHITFDGDGEVTYTDKINICSYFIPQQFPEPSNTNTDIGSVNISGAGTGKQILYTTELSSSCILSTVTLSASDTVITYNIGAIFNSASASKISYSFTSVGSQIPVVSGEVVGDTYQIYTSGGSDWNYSGYILTPDLITQSYPVSYSADNVSQTTPLIVSDGAYNDTQNTYGSQWISFLENPTSGDVEIGNHIAVWDNEDLDADVYYNSLQSERLGATDTNILITRLNNGGVGISSDSTDPYWNIKGARFDFHNNKITDVVKWSNSINITESLIENFTADIDNAVVWDVNADSIFEGEVFKTRIYSIWRDNNIYTTVREVAALASTQNNPTTYSPQKSGSTISLYASGNTPIQVTGTRTLADNISSFNIIDENIFVVDSSPYDDNMWTVHCSSTDASFLAQINSHKDNYTSDFIVSTESISGVTFTVEQSASLFDLKINSSSKWDITGYRIDSRDIIEAGSNISSPTQILDIPSITTIPRLGHTAWVRNTLTSAELTSGDVYSTQLIDVIWDNDTLDHSISHNHIANVNTASSSKRAYSTLTEFNLSSIKDETSTAIYAQPTTYSWAVSTFDYQSSIDSISTQVQATADQNDDRLLEYIFSHPGEYTATLEMTANDNTITSQVFTDQFIVDEIPPTAVLHATTSAVNTITDQFTAVGGVSSLSYFDATPSITQINTSDIYINTLLSRPGSFPIGELYIDFGDNTGISKMTRNGISYLSDRTTSFIADVFDDNLHSKDDPRGYYLKHSFPSNLDDYIISLSAVSVDTRSTSISTLLITAIPISPIVKRLVSSSSTHTGDLIYNILADEQESI